MSSAVAVWSVLVQPGKKTTFVAQSDIHITGATLDASLTDESGRSSVKFTYVTPQKINEEDEDEDTEALPAKTSVVLCSLTPGKIEQASLNLILAEDDEIQFEVIGKNAIHLCGNYIIQPTDFPGDDDSEFGSDEDGYDLRDVSSDVEIDAAELDIPGDSEDDSKRFEEITDVPISAASKKRPRDDAMEVEAEGEPKLDKKEKKKQNKKQKADDGNAVPVVNGEPKPEEKTEKKKEKKDKKTKEGKKEDEKETPKETPKKASGLKELPGGLQIKDVKTGTGKAAKKGDSVSMRYIGKFLDGKVFDSNTKGKPFSFRVGAGEVIKGWDEGIPGMQAGGERLLIVPAKLGYGNTKTGGIPAGSTLRFEVKLVEIKG
ncbi:FKBP-like protein [Phellopilus nigrolimitatus]|nr:FKBP-like protein [Phellopilus nigrolimitatus]